MPTMPPEAKGRIVGRDLSWTDVQLAMRGGQPLAPLLPLGEQAAFLWIPKNGCSTLKRAWLVASGHWPADADAAHLDIHGAALAHTRWLTPEQLREVASRRHLVAVWRDPIERFVSACRSHLVELSTGRVLARLRAGAGGTGPAYEQMLAFHDQLFRRHGVQSFRDDADPVAMLNRVALDLSRWIPCHIDWSHHTLPQTAFLGDDPALVADLVPMARIGDLVAHWSRASGRPIPPQPLHVSADEAAADPFRRLTVSDLSAEARAALEAFYAADRAFHAAWQARHVGEAPGR